MCRSLTTCKLSDVISPAFAESHRAVKSGKINELVAEANGKVMSFVSCQLDPLFESSDLKATGTGSYQEVFDTVDYDNKSGADVVDTLLDGMSAVGYTV